MTQKKLLIAGGGTGGHLFSGLAIAKVWQQQKGEVCFVGTPLGQETSVIPKEGFRLHLIKIGRLKGSSWVTKILTLLTLPRAFCEALQLIKKEDPDLILGIGGYASGPVCLAGVIKKIPTAIVDQNATPGLTNRILGKFVDRIFLSFPQKKNLFKPKKVMVLGNPVRKEIQKTIYLSHQNKMTIFVFGGSQGAVSLNQVFIKAIALLPDLKNRLEILHQARKTDEDTLRQFYQSRGISAVVKRFFDDPQHCYAQAHLVISRAGGGTVSELSLTGRPAILIPYPFAADNHQWENAMYFVENKAAWIYRQEELTPDDLAKTIRNLFEHPEILLKTAENMAKLALPNAAENIVEELAGLHK